MDSPPSFPQRKCQRPADAGLLSGTSRNYFSTKAHLGSGRRAARTENQAATAYPACYACADCAAMRAKARAMRTDRPPHSLRNPPTHCFMPTRGHRPVGPHPGPCHPGYSQATSDLGVCHGNSAVRNLPVDHAPARLLSWLTANKEARQCEIRPWPGGGCRRQHAGGGEWTSSCSKCSTA